MLDRIPPLVPVPSPSFVLPHLGSPACPIMQERLLRRPAGYGRTIAGVVEYDL